MCRHICDIIFSTFGLAHPILKEKEDSMKLIHVLAALPFIGILLGIPFANKVTPYVFGMPFILAYIVMWALLTSALMAIVYVLDKENKKEEAE